MDVERQKFLAELAEERFNEFKTELGATLMKKFGVGIGNCTDDEQIRIELKDGATVEDFSDFLGEKYDLDRIDTGFYS